WRAAQWVQGARPRTDPELRRRSPPGPVRSRDRHTPRAARSASGSGPRRPEAEMAPGSDLLVREWAQSDADGRGPGRGPESDPARASLSPPTRRGRSPGPGPVRAPEG